MVVGTRKASAEHRRGEAAEAAEGPGQDGSGAGAVTPAPVDGDTDGARRAAASDTGTAPGPATRTGSAAGAGTDREGGLRSTSGRTPAPEAPAHRARGRRVGLGRGLAALIPTSEDQESTAAARPLDILFPDRIDSGASVTRGGSQRDLLTPRRSGRAGTAGTGSGTSGTRRTGRERHTAGLFADVLSPGANVSRETIAVGAVGPDSGNGPAAAVAPVVAALPSRAATPETAGGDTAAGAATIPGRGSNGPVDPTPHIPNADPDRPTVGAEVNPTPEAATDLVAVPGATFAEIRTDWIIPNTRQPRDVFDEDELAELAASIAEVGVLQPVVVRPIDTDTEPSEELREALEARPEARYELIMGERRLRATELAGLGTIPAIVRRTDDADLLRDALLENLHRTDLNPLEEASAYQQLMADFGATQEELSRRIARSRPQIANTLRLLRLPPVVQRKVAAGVLSAGHARALLALRTPEEMERLADRIVAEGLSVRTTEELVRLGQSQRSRAPREKRTPVVSALGERVVATLSEAYDTRVTITEGRTKGRIVIEYAGADDLQRLAGLILGAD